MRYIAKLHMTSVSAFLDSSRKIDNYKTDWNRPAIATQHFCASYIRNDMLGTPPIPYICYGFSAVREDALMLSGAKDIYSATYTVVPISMEDEKYYTPNTQIDKTIEYNEMDIRRIQGGVKLQPDYIIVFKRNGKVDNMEEALRVSEQWDGMPIVVIDVDECLEAERAKVYEMLEQYSDKPNVELAMEITKKVRNNRVTDQKFCSEIETELNQLKTIVTGEVNKTKTNEIEVQLESEDKSHSKEIEAISEEQLNENYGLVSAKEREQGVRKIREIYSKIKEISKGGKDDGRY